MSDLQAVTVGAHRASRSRFGIRFGAAIAVGVAVAFVVWLAVSRGGEEVARPTPAVPQAIVSAPSIAPIAEPMLTSVPELRRAAAATSFPVFWSGRRPGTRLEVSRAADGTFFLRYLPDGFQSGDTRAALTVATYPRAEAFAEVTNAAGGKGTARIELPGGGIAVHDPGRPTNVHFAYPGQAYQVEVFSPRPGEARRLVQTGTVRPIQ